MERNVSKLFVTGLFLLAAFLAGCQSAGVTYYTAPEVTGRVLAADSHQPLAKANVQWGGTGSNFEPFGPPKGGQLLLNSDGTQTDVAGRFVLQSKSVFALFRKPGWWSVTVSFSHDGYEAFQTNYTGDNVTSHTAEGTPVVNAGDVMLKPASPLKISTP